jgi:hypothetical protein
MQGTSSIVCTSPHTPQIPNSQSVLSHVSPSCHGNVYTILSPTLVSYSNIRTNMMHYFFLFFFRARQLMPQMHLSLRLIVQP